MTCGARTGRPIEANKQRDHGECHDRHQSAVIGTSNDLHLLRDDSIAHNGSWSSGRRMEDESDAAHAQYHRRIARLVELAAQPADMHVH